MRILQVNKFFYLKGGPEQYMFRLSGLLRSKGHKIAFFSMQDEKNITSEWSRYFVENVDFDKKHGIREQIKISKNLLYSLEAKRKILKLIDSFQPDIAHIHNFNHQLTPSILFALKKKKIPVVITLHDYKLICPSYLLLRRRRICELCRGQRFYNCLITRCYKGSFCKSLALTIESYLHHQILDSYSSVKRFICPTKFVMDKMQEMGLRGNYVHLPHFVYVGERKPTIVEKENNKIIFCGRLSSEKGILTLIEAIKGLSVNLTIIGSGPLKKAIENEIELGKLENVELSGYLGGSRLIEKFNENTFLIMPSECYEVFGMVIIEAFALGLPVIGANIGGIPEVIRNGETGLLFEPGNADELRDKIEYLATNPYEVVRMGKSAKKFVEENFNEERHYQDLMNIYKMAVGNSM